MGWVDSLDSGGVVASLHLGGYLPGGLSAGLTGCCIWGS